MKKQQYSENLRRKIDKMIEIDPYLQNYADDLALRVRDYEKTLSRIEKKAGTLQKFASAYEYFGFHKEKDGWVFREWLPGADKVFLIGDFNGWDRRKTPLERLENGVFEARLNGTDALKDGQYVKLWVEKDGVGCERIPAYIRYTDMDETTYKLCGRILDDTVEYPWTDAGFPQKKKENRKNPLIYEAHVGMAQEKGGVGTYREFADLILPRIQKLGYNTVQLMAIAEHPYYASFGYQVTNFYAPSYRFGTPDDLKYLIDKAHAEGISVLLDVVHSHACPNESEGLNKQDLTENQYFSEGGRGWHTAWGTKLFDYAKDEVLEFLLSNLTYWQKEFHFDGFRFDGVTSMLFEDHGLGDSFVSYDQYFSLNTNISALTYLTLACRLIRQNDKNALTVAEDMSGMPGLCLKRSEAGVGFDLRLSMGLPDYWIKLLKEYSYDHFDMHALWHELTSARPKEKVIGYCESHDQALVGDKTLIFRMADAEMYTGMEKSYHSLSMDAAIDYHKLIRFVTLATANAGYLNFMGNEFGHPEWIDFPREGNGWSYHYARRQWSLEDDPNLKYEWLGAFDREMIRLSKSIGLFSEKAESLWIDQEKQTLSFARGKRIFVFNFSASSGQNSFFVHTHLTGKGRYRTVFSSDEKEFGGLDRVSKQFVYGTIRNANGEGFYAYVPCRTAIVFEKI